MISHARALTGGYRSVIVRPSRHFAAICPMDPAIEALRRPQKVLAPVVFSSAVSEVDGGVVALGSGRPKAGAKAIYVPYGSRAKEDAVIRVSDKQPRAAARTCWLM
jgi:hypothetical protein